MRLHHEVSYIVFPQNANKALPNHVADPCKESLHVLSSGVVLWTSLARYRDILPCLSFLILNTHMDDSRFQAGSVSTTSQVPLSKNAFFSSSMAAIHFGARGDRMAAAYDTGC